MANQKIIESSTKTIKHWTFRKGHMEMNFSIDIEVKGDVVDYLDCVKKAVISLEEELKNYGGNS